MMGLLVAAVLVQFVVTAVLVVSHVRMRRGFRDLAREQVRLNGLFFGAHKRTREWQRHVADILKILSAGFKRRRGDIADPDQEC